MAHEAWEPFRNDIFGFNGLHISKFFAILCRGGVAGGAGGAAAPPGFWMGSKKILGKTTELGKKLLPIAPLLLYLSKITANHLDCFINSLFIME